MFWLLGIKNILVEMVQTWEEKYDSPFSYDGVYFLFKLQYFCLIIFFTVISILCMFTGPSPHNIKC